MYLYFRVASTFALDARGRLVLKIALVTLALLYPTWRLADRFIGSYAGLTLLWPANVWMGLAAMIVSGMVLFDILVLLPMTAFRMPYTAFIGRAAFGLITVFAFVLGAFGMSRALSGPRVVKMEIELARLPEHLDGLRIVAFSDIHSGELVRPHFVEEICDLVSNESPDIIVLLGDLSDESPDQMLKNCKCLGQLKTRYGVFAVTGNHEYYRGGDRTVQSLQSLGITVLRQSYQVIDNGLVLVGVDDPSFTTHGRADMPALIDETLRKGPRGLPTILLSHQPVAVEHAASSGVDLMLCGHTHGGQIPPFHLVTGLAYGYLSGLYKVNDMQLYVTNGAGFWGPPMRIFADPEVLSITLRSASP